MALPYSTRFLLGQIAGGSQLTYVVPAGKIAVVRDIDAMIFAAANAPLLAVIVNGVYLTQWSGNFPAYATFQWRGRQVLNAGDSMEVASGPNTVDFLVSGYLLTA